MRFNAPSLARSTTLVAAIRGWPYVQGRMLLSTAAAVMSPSVPVTPLFASLTEISSVLRENVARMGLKTLTPVQSATLPPLIEGKDVVAKARTGTGKTVAFLIPTLESLLVSNRVSGQIRALVMSPTRELASQIGTAAADLAHGSGLRTGVMFGGTSMGKDRKLLDGELDLLVATPGRLWDHIENEGLMHRLSGLQVLVLDEGDRLLDAGFQKAIGQIVRKLPRAR